VCGGTQEKLVHAVVIDLSPISLTYVRTFEINREFDVRTYLPNMTERF